MPAEAWAPYRALYPGALRRYEHWRLPCRSTTSSAPRRHARYSSTRASDRPGSGTGRPPSERPSCPRRSTGSASRATTIDVVFLTHLHIDHVGWNTDLEGVPSSSRERATSCIRDALAFVRARRTTRPHVRRVHRCPARGPLRDRSSGDLELAPGVTARSRRRATTPGHMARPDRLRRREQALLIADCRRAPGAPAGAGLGLRLRHRLCRVRRRPRHALLPELVDRDVLVACGHYPDDGIGRIVRRNGTVVWEAV